MKNLLIVLLLTTSLTSLADSNPTNQEIVMGTSNEFMMILLKNEKVADGQVGKEMLDQLRSIYSTRITNASTSDSWKKCMNTEKMFADLFNVTWQNESKTYEFLQHTKAFEEILLSTEGDLNEKIEVQKWLIRESETFLKETEKHKKRVEAIADKCNGQ
jgi:hypothetical protein